MDPGIIVVALMMIATAVTVLCYNKEYKSKDRKTTRISGRIAIVFIVLVVIVATIVTFKPYKTVALEEATVTRIKQINAEEYIYFDTQNGEQYSETTRKMINQTKVGDTITVARQEQDLLWFTRVKYTPLY